MSTRLQLEVFARKKAESEKASLEQQIMEMQEQLEEERMVRGKINVDNLSQHGSNSRQYEIKYSHKFISYKSFAYAFHVSISENIRNRNYSNG